MVVSYFAIKSIIFSAPRMQTSCWRPVACRYGHGAAGSIVTLISKNMLTKTSKNILIRPGQTHAKLKMAPWASSIAVSRRECASLTSNLTRVIPIRSLGFLRRTQIVRNISRRFRSDEVKNKNLNAKATKPAPVISEMKRLLILAKPEKWRLAGAVALLFISSGVTMAIPFCMGKVIDTIYSPVNEGKLVEKLNMICKYLVVIFLIGALANFGRVYLMQVSGQNIIKSLREKVFGSIIKQEVGFFDKNKTGELVNRLSADTSLVGQSVTMNISDGLRAVAQAIGGVAMMCYVSPKLTLVALGIVPPVALGSRIYGRYLRNITRQVQDSLAGATQTAEEKIANIRTVRAFAHEDRETQIYNSKIEHVLKLSYKEALARGIFWGMTGLSGNLIVLAVFYYGGIMMTESQITIGDLSAFLLYAAYVGVSVGGMTSFYTEMMRGLGASTRLWELSDREPSVPIADGINPADSIKGNIEFHNVSFYYPLRPEVTIIRGMNLCVPSGSITAVVGSSGSGKSTIGSLLLRYYDPSEGEVVIDGIDICDLNPTWLRQHIGTVSQEPVLFSCSVAENIAYGSSDPSAVSTEQIIDAAKKANAYNFIQSFPKRFETMVGERGLMLSGGQKQRVAIARAILKNPKILLLDEATSALDAESEYLVQDALERLMVGRTVLTIAHRLSTIKSANQIAVLDQGKVAEIGSYQELVQIDNGIFRRLVERQTITK